MFGSISFAERAARTVGIQLDRHGCKCKLKFAVFLGLSHAAPRRLFVTTALPYANGPFHIGHIMEYIQADIWVRFQRMQGHEVHFVCADDAHGAPIMLAAEKAGQVARGVRRRDRERAASSTSTAFTSSFDNWHSTHSPENTELSQDIYRTLKTSGPHLHASRSSSSTTR